jgi:hypothetical protein
MNASEVTQRLREEMRFELLEMGPDSVAVETAGLQKFDRPNLQVAGIPKALAPLARRFGLDQDEKLEAATRPKLDALTERVNGWLDEVRNRLTQ